MIWEWNRDFTKFYYRFPASGLFRKSFIKEILSEMLTLILHLQIFLSFEFYFSQGFQWKQWDNLDDKIPDLLATIPEDDIGERLMI